MKRLYAFILVFVMMCTGLIVPVGASNVEYRYGDATKDGNVDVLDATEIQLYLALLTKLESINYVLADFDNDKAVSVLDATCIQMYLADLIKNPRGNNDYLEFYLEIEGVTIKPSEGTPLLANKSIVFTINFDDVYNPYDDKNLKCDYTFKGITDNTYMRSYSKSSSDYSVAWSFQNAGIYEFSVEISKSYYDEKYTYTTQFEILPAYEFDQKRFVNYNNLSNLSQDYPFTPEDATAVDYETIIDCRKMDLGENYGSSSVSERFVALVNTKEEYDNLFELDNTIFTEEFFENKSLVVAVSPGYDHYDYSSIKAISSKDDVLYIKVVYGNSYPDPTMAHPTAPTWYSFVALDKVDIANITSVQRTR